MGMKSYFVSAGIFFGSLFSGSVLGQNSEQEGFWHTKEDTSYYGIDFGGSKDFDGDGNYEGISAVLYVEKDSNRYNLVRAMFTDKNNDGFYEGAFVQNMPGVFGEGGLNGQKSIMRSEAFRFNNYGGDKVLDKYKVKEEIISNQGYETVLDSSYKELSNKKIDDMFGKPFAERLDHIKDVPKEFSEENREKISNFVFWETVRHSLKD